MIQRFDVLCVLIGFCLPVLAQDSLPREAEHLRKLQDDEKALVDAARQYHLQQMDLTQWDYEITQSNVESTDVALQEVPGKSMEKRIKSIRLVWEYVLSVYSNNVRAMNYFGEYWYDIGGNAAAAITYWKRALATDRSMSFAHNNLGLHYFHTGDYRKGLSHLESALKLEPKNPDFLFNITQNYLNHFPSIIKIKKTDKKKLYREAMKYSQNAARYAPEDFSLAQDYAVNFFAAENFDIEVSWDTAAAAWQVARALAQKGRHVYYCLLNEGRCWLRAEEPEKALPLFESALAIRPALDLRDGNEVVEQLISRAKSDSAKK